MRTIFILTGEPGSGKTTWLIDLIGKLRNSGLLAGGIAAPSIPNCKRSYNLMNIETGDIMPLSSEAHSAGWEKTGRFYFNPGAISLGNKILCNPDINNNDLVVVDEVGPFELDGKIWADSITKQIMGGSSPLLWVVRRQLAGKVIGKWKLKDPVIMDVDKYSINQGKDCILLALKR